MIRIEAWFQNVIAKAAACAKAAGRGYVPYRTCGSHTSR